MKRKVVAALTALVGTVAASLAWAQERHDVLDQNGAPIFQVRIFDTDDGYYTFDDQWQPVAPTWNLSDLQKGRVLSATQYWAALIQAVPGQNPAIVNVGTYDYAGASAISLLASYENGAGTQVHAAITNQNPGPLQFDAHGYIDIGMMNWADGPYTPSHIVLTPEVDMTSVVIHEFGHALGISSEIGYEDDPVDPTSGKVLTFFYNELGLWESHLYDDNHQQARPGQIIYCNVCANLTEDPDGNPLEPDDIFDARNDNAYFGGKHVSDVLAGAMPGVPLTLYGRIDTLDIPIWSHLELKNSLMSHQRYRNYTNLMEAEVAVLQDLGYQIDRRNFWGFSVYGDHQTLVSDNPFFARNENGTAYLTNTYNTAPLGLGLHIYGSNNTIAQRADLLSSGSGGGGIRVDGQENNLTILPGTRVHANGAYGRGVMFAYGRGHTLTQRGDVEALGEHGIAASFDFGHNAVGDDVEYRGSYIRTSDLDTPLPLDELNGPLVTNVDLTGRLAGSYASIYIADNAYVEKINVMGQAQLIGDILSDYNQVDENSNRRLTRLTFGYLPDADGRSTHNADTGFSFAYGGNIVGINNLSLQLAGGVTQLDGHNQVYEVNVAQGASLTGSGHYQIHQDGSFTNAGTVASLHIDAPMTIDGSYAQRASGELQLALNDQRKISSLVVNGNADLDGTISFVADRGYYANGFSVTSGQWLQANTITGSFAKLSAPIQSPTLTATATAAGENAYQVALSRTEDAYAQYGTTSNSRAVGVALYAAADNAASNIQTLLTALDFSAADGSAITSALPRLTGDSHPSLLTTLATQSRVTQSALINRGLAQPAAEGVDIWGRYLAMRSHLDSDGNAAGMNNTYQGMLFGGDTAIGQHSRAGLAFGLGSSSADTRGRDNSARIDNYTLAAYGNTDLDRVALRYGASYSLHHIDSRRETLDGLPRSKSTYNGRTAQVYVEAGLPQQLDSLTLEPFVGLAYTYVHTNAFDESGAAGLDGESSHLNVGFTTLGLRADKRWIFSEHSELRLEGRAGWLHTLGSRTPSTRLSFQDDASFTAAGVPLARDTLLMQAALTWQHTQDTAVGLAYLGEFGKRYGNQSLSLQASRRF